MGTLDKRKPAITKAANMSLSFVIANIAGMMAFFPFLFALKIVLLSQLVGGIIFTTGVVLYFTVLILCYKRLYRYFTIDMNHRSRSPQDN
jgi:hypothetical protein